MIPKWLEGRWESNLTQITGEQVNSELVLRSALKIHQAEGRNGASAKLSWHEASSMM